MSHMYIMVYDFPFGESVITACYTHSIEYHYGHLGPVPQVNNPAKHYAQSIQHSVLNHARQCTPVPKNQTGIPNI